MHPTYPEAMPMPTPHHITPPQAWLKMSVQVVQVCDVSVSWDEYAKYEPTLLPYPPPHLAPWWWKTSTSTQLWEYVLQEIIVAGDVVSLSLDAPTWITIPHAKPSL